MATIHFPPGTPAAVMNAYYAAYLRNQAIPKYDPWTATIENFQKQVLNPFLSTFAQEPLVDYRSTYDTNEKIRQQMELYNSQVAAQQQEALNKYALAQQVATDTGTALQPFLAQMGPQSEPAYVPPPPEQPAYPTGPAPAAPEPPIPPITPPTAPSEPAGAPSLYGAPPSAYGPPADLSPFRYPGQTAANSATGQRYVSDGRAWVPSGEQAAPYQGPPPMPAAPPTPAAGPLSGAAPTPTVPSLPSPTAFQANPQTSLTGALRSIASNPLATGTVVDLLKNQQLASILNPTSQENLAAQIAQRLATAGYTGQRAADLAATQPGRLGAMGAATDLTQARTATEQAKATTAQNIQDIIARQKSGELSIADAQSLIGLELGKNLSPTTRSPYTRTMTAELDIQRSLPGNETKTDAELLTAADRALRDKATQDQTVRAQLSAAARAPAQLGLAGLRQIEQTKEPVMMVASHLAQLQPAIDKLDAKGVLPDSPTTIDNWEQRLQRQSPEMWRDPEVQAAWGTVKQFYSIAIGTYDRAVVNMIGTRAVKDMYSLPTDATLLPGPALQSIMDFMRKGIGDWNAIADARTKAYIQSIQSGSFTLPSTTLPGAAETSGGGAAPLGPGEIRVRQKSSGQTGRIPASEFDPALYEKVP